MLKLTLVNLGSSTTFFSFYLYSSSCLTGNFTFTQVDVKLLFRLLHHCLCTTGIYGGNIISIIMQFATSGNLHDAT